MRATFLAALCFCLLTVGAQAHSRHHHHRHHAVRVANMAQGLGHGLAHMLKSMETSGISRERLADGQVIAVASAYASRFVGFFNDLYSREGHLPPIICLASGHMAHSLHHWGGACDVGQTTRNVAWRAMYHVGELAAAHGLTDGCIWHHPDCGHVDVSGVAGVRYTRHRYHHYARAS